MGLTSHELVPRLQVCVDLKYLHNIDLFSTGYYQLRCHLRCGGGGGGPPGKVDVQLLRTTCAAEGLFPASVVDGAAASHTVEVMYANERIALNDQINFDVTLPTRVEKLNWVELVLTIELWHMDKDEMLEKAANTCDMHSCFRLASSRRVQLRVSPARGLHAHRPVVFDYYHLCAVALTVHASLVGLQQRARVTGKLELSRRVSGSSEEKIRLVHRSACLLLLQAYESIQLRIRAYSKLLQHGNIIRIQMVDTVLKLDALYRRLDADGVDKLVPVPDPVKCPGKCQMSCKWQTAIVFKWQTVWDCPLVVLAEHVQLLSQELHLLWTQFLELFRGSSHVAQMLADEHNATRVKRFGEAFFYSEDTVHGLLASSFVSSSGASTLQQAGRIAYLVRKSAYLQELPHLPCAVPDTDATPTSMPVIFEYKFVPSHAASAAGVTAARRTHSGDDTTTDEHAWCDSDGGSVRRLKDCLNLELRQCARPATHACSGDSANSRGSDGSALKPTKRYLLPVNGSSACTSSMASSSSSLAAPAARCAADSASAAGVYFATDSDAADGTCGLHTAINGALVALHRSCTEPNLSLLRDGPSSLTSPSAVDCTLAAQQSSQPDVSADSAYVPSLDARCNSSRSVAGRSMSQDDHCAAHHQVYLAVDERQWKDDAKELRRNTKSRLCAALQLKAGNLRMKRPKAKDTQRADQPKSTDGGCSAATRPSDDSPPDAVAQLTAMVDSSLVRFVTNKEAFKAKLALTGYAGHLYSDFGACRPPHENLLTRLCDGYKHAAAPLAAHAHIVVCVHGLEGSRDDLKPYVNLLKLLCPMDTFDFLMSETNEFNTYDCFERMGDSLVQELLQHIDSLIAHSMGAVVVRAAVADERLAPHLDRLHCFLSLNGPHCGLLFNQKTASLGVSLVQWWKRSTSLEQLCLRDAKHDYRQSFLYTLSQSAALGAFRYVLLVGSAADLYVPWHSALAQPCKPPPGKNAAQVGAVYNEMVANMASAVAGSRRRGGCTLVRYLCYHGRAADVPRAHHILGRAAHVAPLDDDVFIDKLLNVSVARYFADTPHR